MTTRYYKYLTVTTYISQQSTFLLLVKCTPYIVSIKRDDKKYQ